MADLSDQTPDCADFPLSSGVPSAHASLGLHLATRTPPALPIFAFGSLDRVLEAYARGVLALSDTIRIDGWTTTVGRHLVAACLPRAFRHVAREPWTAVRAARLLDRIARELHVELAARAVDALELLGRHVADRSGFSLAIDDFAAPASAPYLIDEAAAETVRIDDAYDNELYTDGERYNRTLELWAEIAELIRGDARREAGPLDALAACAAADPTAPLPEDLRSIRGVRTTPRDVVAGQRGTFSGGFGCHEYFLIATEARACARAAEQRSRDAQVLLRDLRDAIGDIHIVAIDCGTLRGVRVVVPDPRELPLAHALEGRVTAEPIVTPAATIAPRGSLITPALAHQIRAARVPSVLVRDPQTCEALGGVCSRCFGLAPEDATWPSVGDRVGARAAATIATAAARHLHPSNTFHIC